MRTILLIMKRQPVAQELANALQNAAHVRVLRESDYAKAERRIQSSNADCALIEVAETGAHDVAYCLALCGKLREARCQTLLLCPEQDEQCVAAVVHAKQSGLIADFVFYDASIDYLSSKLLMT